MATLVNTLRSEAPPDEVWAVVGDLTGVAEWVPGVVDTTMEGSTRVCATADGGQIREEIVEYSDADRMYRYRHIDVPLPVQNSHGSFAVKPDGGGSLVTWEAEFDALDPTQADNVAEMVDGYYKQAMESLAQRISQATSSPAG